MTCEATVEIDGAVLRCQRIQMRFRHRLHEWAREVPRVQAVVTVRWMED